MSQKVIDMLNEVLLIMDDLHPNSELSYNAYSQLHDRVSLAIGELEGDKR